MLNEYERDYLKMYFPDTNVVWKEEDIRSFFIVFFHIIPEPIPKAHHYRCVVTILHELGRKVSAGE